MSYDLKSHADGEDFQAVELAQMNQILSAAFIDNASFRSVSYLIFVLSAFIVVHFIAAWRAPGVITKDSHFYAINQTNENASLEMDITLSGLLEVHRFIELNGTLIRNLPVEETTKHLIQVSSRIFTTLNGQLLNTDVDDPVLVNVTFLKGHTDSSNFPVMRKDIIGFDTIQAKMMLTSNFEGISGFIFHWIYCNVSGINYMYAAKSLMALLILYMLYVYISSSYPIQPDFITILTIITGLFGILASNPLSLIYENQKYLHLTNCALSALFYNIFRFFIFSILLNSIFNSNLLINAIIALYFIFNATIETAALNDRLQFVLDLSTNDQTIFSSEQLLILSNIIYYIISIILIFTAISKANSFNGYRIFFYSFLNVLLILSSAFSEIFCIVQQKLLFTIMPMSIMCIVFMTTSAFSIFALHQGSSQEYNKINTGADDGVLDVEQISDDVLNSGNFDNEEDFDGEEEEEEE